MTPPPDAAPSILIVDDEHSVRQVVRSVLAAGGYDLVEAGTGGAAVARLAVRPFDVLLLDLDLPDMSGAEVLRRARQSSVSPHLKVIVLSGQGDADRLSGTLFAGADDFLSKPFTVAQLRARVSAAVRLKQAQDRSERMTRTIATANAELETALSARDEELVAARGALVLALAKLAESRSNETGPHLVRIQSYCRVLCAAAARLPAFATRLSADVAMTIQQASPLHDIGKVAIPDRVLNKPGALDTDERELMKRHAAAGADTLAEVTGRYPFASAFLHAAADIARHHHEKWDGSGYPDGLAGEAIPLAARVVAIADVYDALRSPRVYKPGLSHDDAVRVMLAHSPGHFDPHLLAVFADVHPQFEAVYDAML